jgi:hypothetical protein
MLSLRCTGKALNRLHIKPVDNPPPSTTSLGDWYVNVIYVRRRPLFLLMSEKSLLSVILPTKESANLVPHLIAQAYALLSSFDVKPPLSQRELPAMKHVLFAGTPSRSVLGSMVDFAYHTKIMSEHHPDWGLSDLQLYLANMLVLQSATRFQERLRFSSCNSQRFNCDRNCNPESNRKDDLRRSDGHEAEALRSFFAELGGRSMLRFKLKRSRPGCTEF